MLKRIYLHLWSCFEHFFYLQQSNASYLPPFALHFQAAADFAKAHLPEALRQQLLTYERQRERDREKDKEKEEKKERGGLSYPSILEQQILTLDREMLDKLSATYNEAGMCVFTTWKIQPHSKVTSCIQNVNWLLHACWGYCFLQGFSLSGCDAG